MGQIQASIVDQDVSLSFRLRAVLELRPVAMDLVATIIRHVPGIDTNFRHEMITAFGEAFNNIVCHGYRGRTDGMIEVEAAVRPGELVLCIRDEGHAVDYGSVARPDLDSLPESGMGVYIMHAMVDEVSYRGGASNVLCLTKRMTPPSSRAPGESGPT